MAAPEGVAGLPQVHRQHRVAVAVVALHGRAIRHAVVAVPNVREVVHLRRIEQHHRRERVHWGVPPPFVVEPSCSIQVLKVSLILLRPEPAQVPHLEVRPEVAQVVIPIWSDHKVQQVVCGHQLRASLHEVAGGVPQGGNGLPPLQHRQGEPILDALVAHELEGIIGHVAIEVHIRLHSPVVIDLGQQGVKHEEAAEEAAHVVVRLPRPVQHVVLFHDVTCFGGRPGGDPGRVRPVADWNGSVAGGPRRSC
mmetsp:Transcript_14649/g.44263  ORF Transcript_14649/g.44263 Transcript_14649/m.44263 type:complete len:251 (+) Transcript_14649:1580-2332(+)